jgi:hypothetical protein
MDKHLNQEQEQKIEASQLYETYTGPSLTDVRDSSKNSSGNLMLTPRTRFQIESYIGNGRYSIRVEIDE